VKGKSEKLITARGDSGRSSPRPRILSTEGYQEPPFQCPHLRYTLFEITVSLLVCGGPHAPRSHIILSSPGPEGAASGPRAKIVSLKGGRPVGWGRHPTGKAAQAETPRVALKSDQSVEPACCGGRPTTISQVSGSQSAARFDSSSRDV